MSRSAEPLESAVLEPPINRMQTAIPARLAHIERENNVRILYAAESGSRAWGFASPDSDYDVRFIYAHPVEHYLSIAEHRDVIELPVDSLLDINGWDVRKTLALFRKGNAALYEWLQSPIVYRQDTSFHAELTALMPDYFSPRAACHHYLSMARNAYEYGLQGPAVRLKQYFYALRPLFAAGWILERRGIPPMVFTPLRALVSDAAIQDAIDTLLALKQASGEKTSIPPVALLQDLIAERLAAYRQESAALEPQIGPEAPLNRLFRSLLPT